MIKITDKPKEEKEQEVKEDIMSMMAPPNDIRTIALFGDVDEEKSIILDKTVLKPVKL